MPMNLTLGSTLMTTQNCKAFLYCDNSNLRTEFALEATVSLAMGSYPCLRRDSTGIVTIESKQNVECGSVT